MADTPVDPDMDSSPAFSLWISGPPAAREPLCAALRDRLAARGVHVAPPVAADHEDSTVLSCAAPTASTADGGRAPLRFDVAAGAEDPHASADRVASLLESRGLLPPADAQAERDEAALLDRLRDLGYL
ncbi:MAG TPA: hypothetical protein VFT45_10950 [Longimicrobium sp.]|nr:hypothetical protein [Longimicrobium sp.]